MSEISEKTLGFAAYECDVLQVKEDAGPNQDKVGRIAIYLRSAGVLTALPWCASFVTWCFLQAGVQRTQLASRPASACSWLDWAILKSRAHQDWSKAQRGDLFVLCDRGKGHGHIGFVVETRQFAGLWFIRTIEGNSNNDGSREGTAIVRRGVQGQKTVLGWRPVRSNLTCIRMHDFS